MRLRLGVVLLVLCGSAVAQSLTPPAAPPYDLQVAILKKVAQYVLNYSRELPDFTCTEEVKRYSVAAPYSVDNPAWRMADTLLIRLTYFQQKEQYKLSMINSKPTNRDYKAVGGAKEFGSFGSLLLNIFNPASETRFAYDHTAQLGARGLVLAFRYSVDLKHSTYELFLDNWTHRRTAYSGTLLVSWDSNRVMRVNLKAENIPRRFPIRSSETQVDYDFVDLSGRKFLVSISAELTLATDRSLTRNDERFTLYRKYSADSEIKFDMEPLPPESPDRNQEIKK